MSDDSQICLLIIFVVAIAIFLALSMVVRAKSITKKVIGALDEIRTKHNSIKNNPTKIVQGGYDSVIDFPQHRLF